MNFITLKELKKMVPVASEFKRVPGLKKILEDGIEVILRKQMENHAEVVVYKNGYVSYHFKGLEADRYSFYRVPKALVKADPFQKMSGDAKLLYAVLLDRMSLSIRNGWQDRHGNAYIICTIEEVMDSIHCARQKAVKLLDELEQEFRLIERRRQGLGKPNLLYVKDLYIPKLR